MPLVLKYQVKLGVVMEQFCTGEFERTEIAEQALCLQTFNELFG